MLNIKLLEGQVFIQQGAWHLCVYWKGSLFLVGCGIIVFPRLDPYLWTSVLKNSPSSSWLQIRSLSSLRISMMEAVALVMCSLSFRFTGFLSAVVTTGEQPEHSTASLCVNLYSKNVMTGNTDTSILQPAVSVSDTQHCWHACRDQRQILCPSPRLLSYAHLFPHHSPAPAALRQKSVNYS